jgi:hypothetical protein
MLLDVCAGAVMASIVTALCIGALFNVIFLGANWKRSSCTSNHYFKNMLFPKFLLAIIQNFISLLFLFVMSTGFVASLLSIVLSSPEVLPFRPFCCPLGI